MNAQRRPAEPELMERELPPPDITALPALLRAEIDGQIATARAFPRNVTGFIREATELVCIDEAMAEACIFALPRGKGTDKKTIEGPSARFAEIIQHCFGNNRGGARVVAEDKQFVTAQGTYHDLEKNVQVVMEVKRRITDSRGNRYNADMIGVTGNAAASIAHRNAVLKGIPKALWLPVYERARSVVVGDVTTLKTKRANALAWFAKVGISPEQICARLEVAGVDDIGLDELAALAGIKTAIREGATSPEAAFAHEDEPRTTADVSDLAAALRERSATLAASESQDAPPPATATEPDPKKIRAQIHMADNLEQLEAASDLIDGITDEAVAADLRDLVESRREAMEG